MTSKTSDPIDPLAMARFLVLPGASRLLEAFAAIPPGALRDSVIQHAEVIAHTYAGAPASNRMPDPLHALGAGRTPQLTSRTGREPKTESQGPEIVKMRMAGATVTEIMRTLNVSKSTIYGAVHLARKAGIDIPPSERLRPRDGSEPKRWVTSLSKLSAQGVASVTVAATKRGISPEAYLERRQLVLKMAMEGAGYERILEATGETSSKAVSAWLSNARAAGFKVPYITFVTPLDQPEPAPPAPEPEPVREAVVAPVGRVFRTVQEMSASASAAVLSAAQRRGMTVEAYQDMRESIVLHRLAGKGPSHIASLVGEPLHFVKDALDAAVANGVAFPPIGVEQVREAIG